MNGALHKNRRKYGDGKVFTLRQDGTAPVPGEGADCGIDWPAERELDFDAEGRRLP